MIGIRLANEEDMKFVRHSWVESFRCSHYAGVIPMKDYFSIYHRVLSELMERDGFSAIVAYNHTETSQIFGFLACESGFTAPLVHYTYIKEDFRRLPQKDPAFKKGIATMLMEKMGILPKEPFYYTFKTGAFYRLTKWGGPWSGGIFKPLYARFPEEEAKTHDLEQSNLIKKEDRKCA